ncbi:MAG: hypothetical protein ACM3QZ_02390 [Solirubrobacterales bacterium]
MWEIEQQYTVNGHPNEFGHRRKFVMYIKAPDAGITPDTGIMLVIQGSDGMADAEYWRNLRASLAERYNLVCLGLNYIGAGWRVKPGSGEYTVSVETMEQLRQMLPPEMQPTEAPSNPGPIMKLFNGQDLTVHGIKVNELRTFEVWKDCHDFGYIQAIDCLWSLGVLKQLCLQDNITLNWSRVYAYGAADGGHILGMCQRFAPHTFGLIISDNAPLSVTLSEISEVGRRMEKRWLQADDGSKVRIFIEMQPYYGFEKDAAYYVTEDMLEIRDLQRYTPAGDTRLVLFQNGEQDADKEAYYEQLKAAGKVIEYHSSADALTNEMVPDHIFLVGDRFMDPSSPEHITLSGPGDSELGVHLEFETTNGKYVVDYASGAPVIAFEGKRVVLRFEEAKDEAQAELVLEAIESPDTEE